MRVGRRNVLRGLLVSGLALPAVARAQTMLQTRLQLGWIPNVQYAGEWMALDHGLFRKQGVDVQWFPGGPNAPAAPVMLAAGRADLGYTSWFPFLDAVAKGNDMVLFAAVFPRNPLGIISLPRKPIRKPADLVGARILAQGANEKTAIDATLALAGLPDRWTQIPAGFSPEPLLSGQGDGYTAFSTNQTITLEQMGMKLGTDFFFVSFDELGFRSFGAVLAATRDYLTKNRPAVIGFTQGLILGMQENEKADPSVAAKLAVDKYGADFGLNLQQQTRQNQLQIPLYHYDDHPRPLLTLDRDVITGAMYNSARATGRTNLPDVEKICDFSIVEDANRTL